MPTHQELAEDREEAENALLDSMGIGCIIPNKPLLSVEDEDLEIAEMLAEELEELGVLYDADGMTKIRRFIKRKRIGGK